MHTIEIFAPRFHDKVVLIAKYKVVDGPNKIVFTKTWKDKVMYMDGAKIKTYPLESNGTIPCYAVPAKDFEQEITQKHELQIRLGL